MSSESTIRKDFIGMNREIFPTKNTRRVILWAPPYFIIDPQAQFWSGIYEKRVNEVNPIGRIGSIRQKFGTKSTHFKIKGDLNFENYFRKWNKYFKGLGNLKADSLFDPRTVKYIMEYLYTYDLPILMRADYDISFVTIDRMEWELHGDKRMRVSYIIDLYEIRRLPIMVKFPVKVGLW